jgi:maleylacetate reductase
MRFVHDTLSQRVRFGTHEAGRNLSDEVSDRGAKRIMVIASGSARQAVSVLCAQLPVVVWHDDVVMHVPTPVAARARDVAMLHDVDLIVCVGGGSAIGLAKAVALTSALPIVAVPTTYAGSEATRVWGITDDKGKTTGVDVRVLPKAIIYDAALTQSLPPELSVASGLNALAHCIDSLWAPNADPINSIFAVEGARVLSAGLPVVALDPTGLPGREEMLLGAYFAASSFASAGSGFHHKICHVLGGMFDLPHAQTHAVVIPHVLAFNAPMAPEAEARLAGAFRSGTAGGGLRTLLSTLHAPTSLRDLGMPKNGIDAAAQAVLLAVPPTNPTAVTQQNLVALLRAAWKGDQP